MNDITLSSVTSFAVGVALPALGSAGILEGKNFNRCPSLEWAKAGFDVENCHLVGWLVLFLKKRMTLNY